MATQTTHPAPLRKPEVLRRLLRENVAKERRTEKKLEEAKASLKLAKAENKKAIEHRRSVEDELEQVCSGTDREW